MIKYCEFEIEEYLSQVKEILSIEGWNSYLKDDDKLIRAYHNSLLVYGAFEQNKLLGFIRMVGDGEHFIAVQDLIVRKDYQKQGIGKHLFKYVWDYYKDCRMFHVVTDLEDEVDNKFYQSFGMKKLVDGHMVSYFRDK